MVKLDMEEEQRFIAVFKTEKTNTAFAERAWRLARQFYINLRDHTD